MPLALVAALLFCPQTPPKPAFQGDLFGEMGRAFCVVLRSSCTRDCRKFQIRDSPTHHELAELLL